MYLWMIEYKFDNIPIALYSALFFTVILFPITWILIADNFKKTVSFLNTNQNLIHTIKVILEVFPEGVLIRSLDSITKQTVLKFANETIKRKLFGQTSDSCDWNEFEVKPIDSSDDDRKRSFDRAMSFVDFINQQELNLEDIENPTSISEQLIELRKKVQYIEESKDSESSQKSSTSQLCCSVKTIKVNWEDNRHSYLHVFIDTSQIKKLEEERAKSQCQQLMFASVSHELRTPLNAFVNSQQLIGYTLADLKKRCTRLPEVADKIEPLYPKFEKYLKVGEVSSKLLMVLVEDILDYIKFSSNTFSLNVEWFCLRDLLAEIEFIYAFQWQEKQIQFAIECDSELRTVMFRSDVKRVKQVLVNLISNSYKFTETGGICVKVRLVHRNNSQLLQFSVIDTGIGISEQDMPKLFKMFGTIQKNINQLSPSGSGIGLSISKKIVESLGGDIRVVSVENKMTNFTFTIQNIQVESQMMKFERDEIEEFLVLSSFIIYLTSTSI